MGRNLSPEFEHDFATALVFTELVLGGDPLNPDGKFRHFVDAYYSGAPLPGFYFCPEAKRIRSNLDKDGNPSIDAVAEFLKRRSVDFFVAQDNLFNPSHNGDFPQDPYRREHIHNILYVANTLLRIQLHELNLDRYLIRLELSAAKPTYDQIYTTVYGEAPVFY